MRDYNAEFDQLMKEVIAPSLKDMGFRKKANKFRRTTNDLNQIFTVQKSQWNSNEGVRFAFNIGFFNSEFFEIQRNSSVPDVWNESDCFFHFRAGEITHGKDYWYELNDAHDYDEVVNDISSHLQKCEDDLLSKFLSLQSFSTFKTAFPRLDLTFPVIIEMLILMKNDLREEAEELARKTYHDALVPKSNVSIATSPDGTSVETKSEPKINRYFLEAIQRLASKYNIELN